ncbi:MAG: MFS transporter [Parasphingorhabdus sp.]
MADIAAHKYESGFAFNLPRVSHRTAALYGVGSIGTAIFVIVPQLYLLFFMTDVLGIPPVMAGAVLLVPKIWEFVFDPLLGNWSDGLDTRWGRRAPLMVVGSVLFGVSFAGLFGPPVVESKALQALVMGLIFLFSTSAYALFSIPYITIPAEMPDKGLCRVRTVSWRMAFVSVGILFAGTSAPLMVDRFGGGVEGFSIMGFVLAAIAAGTMALAITALKKMPQRPASSHTLPLYHQVRMAASNRPFLLLGATYVLQLVATAISLAMLPFFVKYVLQEKEALVTGVFAVFTFASLLALPVTAWAARRFGEALAYQIATIIYGAGQIAILGSALTGQSELFVLAMGVVGIGNAGQQLLPFAMLPRAIDLDRKKTGENREGAFTGFWIAGEKLGLALGGFIAATVLSIAGFVEAGSEQITQPPSAIIAIAWQMSVIPGVLFLSSLWPLTRFETALNGDTIK